MNIVLDGVKGNYEAWNSNLRNELLKRDCLHAIKYPHDYNDKSMVIENKNVVILLNKSVESNLLHMVEGKVAYETYEELVDMAPNKSSIVWAILAEAPAVITPDMQAYVLAHQSIHSKLMKADPQAKSEASTHAPHMNRLLDGITPEQRLTRNYQFSTWENCTKSTAKYVFKVGLKLVNDLGSGDTVLAAAAATGNKQGNPKEGDDEYPIHPCLFHKLARYELNLNATEVAGRYRRKAENSLRSAGGTSGGKKGSSYKQSDVEEIKALKSQISALLQAGKVEIEIAD